jgi:hypothetical protein
MKQRTNLLQLRLSKLRDVFDLSASANLQTSSLPISLPVLSENEMKSTSLLLLRMSEVRDEFNLSASDNLVAPSSPISFTD